MPQFPIQPPKPDEQSDNNPSSLKTDGNAVREKPPIKFKTAQPAGPVARVRIKDASKSSTSRKSPFKDDGLFEDKDSLTKFRDDVGRPLILTLAAIALVAFIYWFSTSGDDQKSIDEKLQSLLAQAEELQQETATTPDQYQTRIELADQLIGLNKETTAVDQGATIKLKTLTRWMTENLLQSNTDPEIQNQLEATSRQFINSRNKQVSHYAKLGVTLIRASNYLESPEPSYFREIVARFQSVANLSKDDVIAASTLMDIAKIFEERGFETESSDFYQAVNYACSNSHDQVIAQIGLEAKSKLASFDSLADDLKMMLDGVKNSKDFPLEAIRKKIKDNTSKENINAARMTSILDFVEFLLHQNAIPQIKLIMDDLSDVIDEVAEGIQRDTIKSRYDDISTLVTQFGQTFNFDGLYSAEGRPISQASLQQKAKFVVFWSPDNSKSFDLVKQLSRNHLEFKQRNIQVIAIANVSDDAAERNKILELSNETKGIDFLTLAKGNSQSQAMFSRYPIPGIPYWILLDPDDKIRGFKTTPRFLQLDTN